jgi:Ala-tRNA(Pro) deacylase
MPVTRTELFARLRELGIETRTVEHAPVFTVAQSEKLERDLPGGHTKNLFLKDAKDRLFLVTAESHNQIDLKSLHKRLGCARLSFGKPELLQDVLGVAPGSVTPFALVNDRACRVSFVLDAQLMDHDYINLSPAREHGDDQRCAWRLSAVHSVLRSRAAHSEFEWRAPSWRW